MILIITIFCFWKHRIKPIHLSQPIQIKMFSNFREKCTRLSLMDMHVLSLWPHSLVKDQLKMPVKHEYNVYEFLHGVEIFHSCFPFTKCCQAVTVDMKRKKSVFFFMHPADDPPRSCTAYTAHSYSTHSPEPVGIDVYSGINTEIVPS